MEKSDAKTRDFLNVESFVQLRFTPLPPPKINPIRLFGKEFGGNNPPTATINHHETKKPAQNRRKFECHYCRRNFHTSQALGGHQNAHRRERLRAKRTHISANEQLYGIVNRHYLHHHHWSANCMVNNITTSSRDQTRVIAGRPWRFPAAVQNSTAFNGGGLLNLNSSGGSSPVTYVHETKPRFYDQLSLDLHL